MVIILFNTGLYKSVFSTHSFGKLVFCLSALFVITVCSEFDALFTNFCNICIIIIYIVGVECFCSHLSVLTWTICENRLDIRHIYKLIIALNPLNANPTKRPNTLKQFVGKLPTNCLSVFDHFVKLALKGLIKTCLQEAFKF